MSETAEYNEVGFTRICSLENTFEAQLVSSILNERAIAHRIRSHHDTAYDGLFQVQKGWGEILAAPEFREDILEIINEIRAESMNKKDQ